MIRFSLVSAVLALGVLAIVSSPDATPTAAAAARATATTLYVSPSGSDSAAGTASAPLRTIQAALNLARAGATIVLAPGSYHESLHTVAAGTATAPITIQGPETGLDPAKRHVATLYGTGRIVSVDHSFLRLRGFTIDGEEKLAATAFPTTLTAATAFKDSVQSKVADSTMVFVGAATTTRGVTGTVLDDMYLHAAGGDCVRIRNAAASTTISRTRIDWCGMLGKSAGTGVFRYHNGEGVYVGTSPKSTDQPMAANDTTSGTLLDGDVVDTFGSECLDVKENAHDNGMRGTTCSDNTEPLADYGANVELRGYANTIVGDTIAGSLGYGVKIASDGAAWRNDGNSVRSTAFSADTGAALRVSSASQGLFCGNTFAGLMLDGTAVGTPTAACPS